MRGKDKHELEIPSDIEIREFLHAIYGRWLADGTYNRVIKPAIESGNIPILGLDLRRARNKDITRHKMIEFTNTNGGKLIEIPARTGEEIRLNAGSPAGGNSRITAVLWFTEPNLPLLPLLSPCRLIQQDRRYSDIKRAARSVDMPNHTDIINAYFDMREDGQLLKGDEAWNKTCCHLGVAVNKYGDVINNQTEGSGGYSDHYMHGRYIVRG